MLELPLRRWPSALSLLLVLPLLSATAEAQGATQILSGMQTGENFGHSIAASGDLLAVRSFNRVDVFQRGPSGWNPFQSIPITNFEPGGALGQSLSLHAGRLAIGIPYGISNNSNPGLVSLYESQGANLLPSGELQSPDPQNPGAFGWSLSQDGQRILVGAPFYQEGFASVGHAFVFENGPTGWTLVADLRADAPKHNDNFGFSVDLSGDRLVVGARLQDSAGPNSGAAYIFEKSGNSWLQTQKLLPPTGGVGAGEFGRSVAIDGDTLVIGSLRALGTDFLGSGAAYVYRRGALAFEFEDELTATSTKDGDGFGISVTLSESRLLVGACYNDSAGQDNGSVTLFENLAGWWIERQTYYESSPISTALAGWSTALAGDDVLAGTLTDYGSSNTDPGTVRVHSIAPIGSCGSFPYAQNALIPNQLALAATPAVLGKNLLVGMSTLGLPAGQIWFSTGPAKVVLPFGTLAIDLASAVSLPTAPVFGFFLGAIALPNQPMLAGQSLFLQGIGVDPDPAKWALSHGLKIVVCP